MANDRNKGMMVRERRWGVVVQCGLVRGSVVVGRKEGEGGKVRVGEMCVVEEKSGAWVAGRERGRRRDVGEASGQAVGVGELRQLGMKEMGKNTKVKIKLGIGGFMGNMVV
ncbi:hypothetical protein GOBAR_AA09495 [Gossypium barbadense]|uniref:Uncharacterized protein n=1 Tax=Gossypium barbadense TaxID=3634 RepID=A0A2P5Y6B0_GOSBA|nr:hypothetical protein GOBAR_AA09495 [Gossypium barbadense]